MIKKERLKKFKILNACTLGWAILAAVFLIAWYYMDNYVMYTLNSDHSSDLVLGHLLAEENAIVSKNWYYSTVLKVVDINLVWALLFKFTDNWHTVRVLGSMMIYTIMLLCLWFCCRQAGLKKYFGYVGAMILLPISKDYFDIVMRGVYYATTIVMALLTMGLCFSYICNKNRRRNLGLLTVGMVLSFIGGLGGPMQLVMFNLPMVLSAMLLCWNDKDKEKFRILTFSLVMTISTAMGYMFSNSVLVKIYQFQSYEQMQFTHISINNIMNVVNGWLDIFGYKAGESVFSSALLFNMAAGIWVLLSFYSAVHVLIKRERYSLAAKMIAAMYLAYFTVMLLVFSMSSKGFIGRYLALAGIFAILAVFACFGNSAAPGGESGRVLAAFTAMVLICGAMSYNDMRKIDETRGQREVAQTLVEQGYTQGYATFWNANVLTELSNGKLEVWHWNDGVEHIETLEDINNVYKWLQAKSHVQAPPAGRLFILLSANEDYYFEFTKKLSQDNVIYRADNYYDYGYKDYIAYGFDSYEELAAQLAK